VTLDVTCGVACRVETHGSQFLLDVKSFPETWGSSLYSFSRVFTVNLLKLCVNWDLIAALLYRMTVGKTCDMGKQNICQIRCLLSTSNWRQNAQYCSNKIDKKNSCNRTIRFLVGFAKWSTIETQRSGVTGKNKPKNWQFFRWVKASPPRHVYIFRSELGWAPKTW